jgi:hypothetical protein
MKKNILISLVVVILAGLALSPALAQKPNAKDLLLPPEAINDSRTGAGVTIPHTESKDGEVGFKTQFVPSLINILLGIAGIQVFIAFVYSGIMLIIQHDEEEPVTQVRKIFVYSLIGLAIIASAYAIVFGVFTLSLE